MRYSDSFYVGTGSAFDVDLPFEAEVLIVRRVGVTVVAFKTAAMAGALAINLISTGSYADALTLFPGKFRVGTDASVNSSGQTYYWTAFGAESGFTKVGSYVGGTPADNRNISGIGFQSDVVLVVGDGGNTGVLWLASKGGDASWRLGFGFGVETDNIQGVGATTFQVGSNANVNFSGRTYYYWCLKKKAGNIFQDSYPGNSSDNRNIVQTDVFLPDIAFIRREDNGSLVERFSELAGDPSLTWSAPVTSDVNRIQQLNANGFQVGTDTTVNQSTKTYHYFTITGVGFTADAITPIDASGGVSFDALVPGTARIKTAFDAAIPSEAVWVGHVQNEADLPVQASAVVVYDAVVPIEAVKQTFPVISDALIAIASRAVLILDAAIAVEAKRTEPWVKETVLSDAWTKEGALADSWSKEAGLTDSWVKQ